MVNFFLFYIYVFIFFFGDINLILVFVLKVKIVNNIMGVVRKNINVGWKFKNKIDDVIMMILVSWLDIIWNMLFLNFRISVMVNLKNVVIIMSNVVWWL